ncbi:MAG: TraB/GumN family protein [Bacteroidota bacterium]
MRSSTRLFLVFTCLFVGFVIPVQAQRDRPAYKLLWKISGKGLKKPSYLFGTMHLKDKRVYEFSDSVLAKLDECEAFAMELHPDTLVRSMFDQMFGSAKKDSVNRIREMLSKEDYKLLDERLQQEAGVSIDRLKNKSPWLIELLLNKSVYQGKNDKPTFLDAHLYYLARLQHKAIIGMERMEEQIIGLEGGNLQEQVEEIKEVIPTKKNNAFLDKFIAMYQTGDVEQIYSIAQASSDEKNQWLKKRNHTMVARIDSFIQRQTTFITMGAAHLAGEDGMIRLLRQKGYEVTPVQATFTGMAARYQVKPAQDVWQTFAPEEGAYTVDMPGKPYPYEINERAGIAMQVLPDLGTGMVYYAFSVTAGANGDAQNKEKQLKEMINRMAKRPGMKMLSERSITFQGHPGRELDMISLSEAQYIKCRVYMRDSQVYMLMAGGKKEQMSTAVATRFFDSFHFTDFKIRGWKEFVSREGSFSFQTPGIVKTNVTESENESTGTVHLHTFASTDEAKGNAYAISFINFPPGFIIKQEKTYMDELIQSTVKRVNGVLDKEENISVQGYPGRDFQISIPDNDFLYQSRVFIRGARPYVLVAVSSKRNASSPDVAQFFRSVTLTPFQKPSWQTYTLAKQQFHIDLPSEPQHDSDTIENYSSISSVSYNSYDASASFPYSVVVTTYSAYDQFANDSTFFHQLIDGLVQEEDTLLQEKKITVDGWPGRELVIHTLQNHTFTRIRSVLRGRKLYQLLSYLPEENVNEAEANRFFNSLHFTKEKVTETLFSRKTERLLQDLTSADTTVQKSATNALYSFDFEPAEQPLLYKALQRTYPNDTAQYGGTRQQLFNSLKSVSDTGTVSFIAQLYFQLPEHPILQQTALRNLVSLNTPQSLTTLLDLLSKKPPVATHPMYLFYALKDSLTNVPVMYPRVLELLANPYLKKDIYELTVQARDSNVITTRDFASVKSTLIADVQAILAKRTPKAPPKETYDKDAALLQVTARLLGSFADQADCQKLLQTLLIDRHMGVSFAAAVTLLKAKSGIDRKKLEKIAADPEYRMELYQKLKEAKQLDLFPAKYLTQTYFAESELMKYLTDDESFPEQMELLAQREVSYEGQKGMAYLFKFKYVDNEEGKAVWYTGMSGLFPLDRKQLVSDSNLTFSHYKLLSSQSIDDHFKEYLTPAEE